MTQRTRKLIGTVLLLGSLFPYVWAGMAIYEGLLTGLPWWVLIPYFCVAGLGWFYPASWIVRWMSRPDRA